MDLRISTASLMTGEQIAARELRMAPLSRSQSAAPHDIASTHVAFVHPLIGVCLPRRFESARRTRANGTNLRVRKCRWR